MPWVVQPTPPMNRCFSLGTLPGGCQLLSLLSAEKRDQGSLPVNGSKRSRQGASLLTITGR